MDGLAVGFQAAAGGEFLVALWAGVLDGEEAGVGMDSGVLAVGGFTFEGPLSAFFAEQSEPKMVGWLSLVIGFTMQDYLGPFGEGHSTTIHTTNVLPTTMRGALLVSSEVVFAPKFQAALFTPEKGFPGVFCADVHPQLVVLREGYTAVRPRAFKGVSLFV